MAELSKLFVVIGAKTAGFSKGMDKVEGRMQQASRKMKILGTAIVGAVAAIGVTSLKMAADFDSAMREVNTMMLLSEDEFKGFSDEVQALAKEMGVNAVEAANALYQAISAGVPKENAIDFLRIATKAAIGGVTDTKTAVDGLTTVLNAFKIPISDAQRVADIMFTTVKGGKTTFQELAASLFNVAPIAAASGVSFEEVSAALASITKQGVPTAVATTQLRAAIQAVTAPTVRQKKMMEELGLSFSAAELKAQGLAGTFNKVMEATGGNMEQMRKLVGSVEAVQAILALTGDNAEVFAADLEAMGNSAGAATDAFDQMEKTTARQFAKIQQAFKDMAITLGKALMPAIQKLVKAITPMIKRIGEWMEKHPKLTAAILITTGALGGLLLILPQITVAFRLMTAAFMAHPFVAVAAAIGIFISIALVKLMTKTKDVTKEVTADFKKIRDEAITNFKDMAIKTQASFESMRAVAETESGLMRDKVIQNFDDMFASVEDIIKSRRDASILMLTEMYNAGTIASKEELQAQIANVHTGADKLIGEFGNMQAGINAAIEAQDYGALTDAYIEFVDKSTDVLSIGERTTKDILGRTQDDIDRFTAEALAKRPIEEWLPSELAKKAIEEIDRAYQEQLETLRATPGITEEVFNEMMDPIEAKRDADIAAILAAQVAEEEALGIRYSAWETFVHKLQGLFGSQPTLEPPAVGGIPGLQKGGILRKPTLALLGESGPEAVIPLGKGTIDEADLAALSNGQSGAAGPVINIQAGAMMGNESEARQFARLIHRYLREENRTRTVGITV